VRQLVTTVCALALLFTAAKAAAETYETFIDIEVEEDLYDLHAADQISDDTLETLLELYQRGVNLNEASRAELFTLPNLTYAEVDAILAYREFAGWIDSPAALVVNGIISERKLKAIAPFLIVRDQRVQRYDTSGWVRVPTRWSQLDQGMPPTSLRARVNTLHHLQAGVAAAVMRQRVGAVAFDPNRGALSAERASPGFEVPKAYVAWQKPDYELIAGTYRIGFGQRLTFDKTRQVSPNGIYADDELTRVTELTRECKESAGELPDSPCAGEVQYRRVTPDFKWSTGLLGVAGGLKHIPAGDGSMQLYAFASHQPHSIYQYQIYDRGECDDPRDCSAPSVYVREDEPLAPTTRHSFQTLPNMYAESTLGANATYRFHRGTHIGVTGYGSRISWLVDGMDLDFQDWARVPYGGGFGAMGIDGAYALVRLNLFGEVAHSFDSMPDGGGGLAALVRGVYDLENGEVEGSLRYYDTDYANPHSRGLSAPTSYDGLRARDEVGARVRYTARFNRKLNLRTLLDLYHRPSVSTNQGLLYARSDYDLNRRWGVGYWTQYQDKGIGTSGRDSCFETATERDDITGRPVPCGGKQFRNIARLRYAPNRRYIFAGQLQHQFIDDDRYVDRFRQDLSSWITLTANPRSDLRIRMRSRYLFEDVSDNGYREQSIWNYADVTYHLSPAHSLRARYDLIAYLDERTSSTLREPSPEQWVWLELHSKF
jgi:hypothetical protein